LATALLLGKLMLLIVFWLHCTFCIFHLFRPIIIHRICTYFVFIHRFLWSMMIAIRPAFNPYICFFIFTIILVPLALIITIDIIVVLLSILFDYRGAGRIKLLCWWSVWAICLHLFCLKFELNKAVFVDFSIQIFLVLLNFYKEFWYLFGLLFGLNCFNW